MSMCIDHKTEGNLRKNTLQEIWEGKDAFCRNREFDQRKMEGVCRSCQSVQLCRGGCFMMRYAWSGNPYGENAFCSYAQYLKGNREPVQNADT